MSSSPLKNLVEAQIKKYSGTILSSEGNTSVFKMRGDCRYQVTGGESEFVVTKVGDPAVLLEFPFTPPVIIIRLGQLLRTLNGEKI
jgi:hypothetical protein